jgi:hypothetical protein
LLEATSGFLATRAIAGGGQNRPADCFQFHLAASAYLKEVFLLFLVHCDRPFVGPVYEVILALVRNVRNGDFGMSQHARLEATFADRRDDSGFRVPMSRSVDLSPDERTRSYRRLKLP